ncbi:MAG: AlpA family phage regulatory protein [Acidobacteria bacterium]|nr:AlpA family phage regulatory protein [Acidobacteriota bacterium]
MARMDTHTVTPTHPSDREELVAPAQAARECGGLSQSQRWRMEQRGDFPKRIPITPGRSAYLRSEIERWKADRIAAGLAARAAK